MSHLKFEQQERKRELFLKKRGWKKIEIISRRDFMPSENKIFEIINFSKDYLISGHSWIKFDIDEQKVITSQFVEEYEFGELKSYHIFKRDLENNEEVS